MWGDHDDEPGWDESISWASRGILAVVAVFLMCLMVIVCGAMCWAGLYFTGVWDG